jgi:hypothetical protein
MKMATYGFGVPGQVLFTGYTNTLGSGQANQDAVAGYVAFNGTTQLDNQIAQVFRKTGGNKVLQGIWQALTGATVGATATKTKKQVLWQQGSPGGLIPIETVNLVNRSTVANDLAALQGLINRVVQPATYAADVSGNGGGGKQTSAGGGAY